MENEESYPYTSLCRVIDGAVVRLADISGDEIYAVDSTLNRNLEWMMSDRFYVPNNFFGVWNWRPQKNSAPVARFNRDKVPIEIIIWEDCRDEESLIKRLRNGVRFNLSWLSSGKALISYVVSGDNYCGVFRTDEDIDSDGKMKVEEPQLFRFNEQDVIRVAGRFFYSKLTLEIADKISAANIELDRIKRETTAAISEANTQLDRIEREIADLTKRRAELEQEIEYLQSARDEISAQPLPMPATTKALQNTTHNTSNFIRLILEKVVSRAQQVNSPQKRTPFQKFLLSYTVEYLYTEIAKENYDDEIIIEVIQECPDLLDKYQTIITGRANVELDRIKRETAAAISEANAQLDRIGRDIADLTKRRAELEQEIEYLQSARDDFSARPIPPPASQKFYRPGRAIEGAAPAADINDFIYAFEDALGMTGKETYPTLNTIDGFARYLRSAFDNDTPLLLTGTRARAVADAFSIALTGRTAALFDCAGVKCLDDLNDCASADDQIIALLNPFAPDFIACLPELIGIKGKFFFALHPFVDDLRLEPPELYNYFLPVFTDLIFDDRTADNRARKILRTSNVSKEYAVLFAKFPLAYVKGRGKKFLDEFKGDKDIGDRLRTFLGDDDE